VGLFERLSNERIHTDQPLHYLNEEVISQKRKLDQANKKNYSVINSENENLKKKANEKLVKNFFNSFIRRKKKLKV